MSLQIPRRTLCTGVGHSKTSTNKPGDVLELHCGKGTGTPEILLI